MIALTKRTVVALALAVLGCATPALAADAVYEVTVFTRTTSSGVPGVPDGVVDTSDGPQANIITDLGPQPGGGTRWVSFGGVLGGLVVSDRDDATTGPGFGASIGGTPLPAIFAWFPGPAADGTVDPHAFFYVSQSSNSSAHFDIVTDVVAFGRRVQPPKVIITQPKAQPTATVTGTTWIVLWVEGTSGAVNTFTLRVDGVQIATRTTTTRGPVSLPWTTTGVANGTHTLSGSVIDATGNTGSSASVTVLVNN